MPDGLGLFAGGYEYLQVQGKLCVCTKSCWVAVGSLLAPGDHGSVDGPLKSSGWALHYQGLV